MTESRMFTHIGISNSINMVCFYVMPYTKSRYYYNVTASSQKRLARMFLWYHASLWADKNVLWLRYHRR